MENYEKYRDINLSELQNESSILTSEIESRAHDAVYSRDALMITFFQNNALHVEIEAYLDYLKIHTFEIQTLQIDQQTPEDELDSEIREMKKMLQEAINGIRQYANKTDSGSWNVISVVRDNIKVLQQEYSKCLAEKQNILQLREQEEADILAEQEQIKIIFEALRNQLTEEVAIHSEVMLEYNNLLSELSLKSRMLKEAIGTTKNN
ncbi:uncharacterized protein LOC129780365 [Toxorhynchites rutilus septentrionalis]|uniref:uncharacterized protein LOC129780365 n=1 Tax=Toxorhynchites rutilus septentrionalis TaxID=329112 RepID=UPI00247A19FE|nr:uncharacterized protein LOC129780365 [Toxorhynchites rutilus septentrionalis]